MPRRARPVVVPVRGSLQTPPRFFGSKTALADSFDYGATLIKEQTNQSMIETIQTNQYLGPSSKARVIYFLLGHTWDIYGQMAVYLRLNGITPPASQGLDESASSPSTSDAVRLTLVPWSPYPRVLALQSFPSRSRWGRGT